MSGTILFANNAGSVLASALSSSAETAILAPGTGILFPNPAAGQYFQGTFVSQGNQTIREIVTVTGMSGDTITAMARGQEGTAAIPWGVGDYFQILITAGTLKALQSQIVGSLPITGGALTGPIRPVLVDDYAASGSGASNATVLLAQTCIITDAAEGYFVLPTSVNFGGLNPGPITVYNEDPENTALIYPPEGCHFNGQPAGVLCELPSGCNATFNQGSTVTQWWF
jgi:hypothetical protein